jgi:hypothetical protein
MHIPYVCVRESIYKYIHTCICIYLLRADQSALRQHTLAYVSIRQHTAAYVYTCGGQISLLYYSAQLGLEAHVKHAVSLLVVSIRQHTSAYVSTRQHTSAYVSTRQHTSAYVSIRQHTSAYASIRQHTSAYEKSGVSATRIRYIYATTCYYINMLLNASIYAAMTLYMLLCATVWVSFDIGMISLMQYPTKC